MNLESSKYTLKIIAERYFVKSKKQILHYGDCEIYAADRPFCSCGLLHQLNYLDYTLAKIIYPKFEDDNYLQASGIKRPKARVSKKTLKMLEKVFGPMPAVNLEELKMDYEDYKKVLISSFGTKAFIRRLDYWFKKEAK